MTDGAIRFLHQYITSKKCVHLICNARASISKKCKTDWHYMAMCKICTNILTTAPYIATKLRTWNKTVVPKNIYTYQGIKSLPLFHIKSQKPWLKKKFQDSNLIKAIKLPLLLSTTSRRMECMINELKQKSCN